MTSVPLEPPGKSRLHGLDYLRGLAAVGIMAYHYVSWSLGPPAASSVLGRVGIYGVAIFYVLSGQTLAYMYASTFSLEAKSLIEFYRKRFFRIFPLLWLATGLSILLSKHVPNVWDLFLNLTGLFGLLKWDTYFATGAWSIGNELAFYVAFPLLIYGLNTNRAWLAVLLLGTASSFVYFAFQAIELRETLASQWHLYTNPANQFAFFLSGALIGRFINPAKVSVTHSVLLASAGVALLLVIPIGANTTELVIGSARLLFGLSCLLVCSSFFRTARAPGLLDKPLALLGQASYSVYLLHPIMYAVVKAGASFLGRIGFSLASTSVAMISAVLALAVSFLSYRYFEQFFIKLGHKRKKVSLPS